MSSSDLLTRPILFEIAWEVCNQIGGIYTVIKTKAPTMVARWSDNYVLVGPYNPSVSAIEFEPCDPLDVFKPAIESLRTTGADAHFGHWLIPGHPAVILIDSANRRHNSSRDKYLLWKDNGVSLPSIDPEIDDFVAFGFATADLLNSIATHSNGRKIVAHFHEWMTGLAIPRLRHMQSPVATVFTTHATLLGRYLASNDVDFYRNLPYVNPGSAAHHYNITSRHEIERASAHASHVFTTVSEVTARESEFLLGRRPDFVLPNGLHPHRFAALHEFQNLHLKYKEKIHEFVMGHFFPSYSFDLDRTIYIFTSGRYEYRNKGMDLFIESLYRLNQRLRDQPKAPTVVAFIITRAPTRSLTVTSLQNHLMFEDLKGACHEIEESLGAKLLGATARGRIPTFEELLPNGSQVRLKRAILARRCTTWPPIVTHEMTDDGGDPVLRHLRHRGLFNSPQDPVKVVFHPDFVTVTSLLGLDYEQFVRGCHLGVFPSYYEPWGYTPLECIALGIPTVTTDLSGFGAYVQKELPDSLQNGVLVLDRASQSADETIETLTSFLQKFTILSRRERISLRNRAERLTERFTWDVLAAHYHRAHAEALGRIAGK